MTSNVPSTRLVYIDILKVLATFMIVMLHVSALYVSPDAALLHPSGASAYIINAFCRTALPLFMMISGALLLRDSYQFNFKKRFFFILKYFLVWSALYALTDQLIRIYLNQPLFTLKEMLAAWISGPYHFWYLQMLLGFYLLMPILSKLKGLQTLSYATLLMFVILYVYFPCSSHLPQSLASSINQLIIFVPSAILFFFFLGASIGRLPMRPKLAIAALLSLLLGACIRFYQLFSSATYADCELMAPHNSYSELLMAAGIFYLVQYFSRNLANKPRLMHLSNCTLRIYIVSALVIYIYQYGIRSTWDAHIAMPGLSIILWAVAVFVLSFLISHILSLKDRAVKKHRAKRRS